MISVVAQNSRFFERTPICIEKALIDACLILGSHKRCGSDGTEEKSRL